LSPKTGIVVENHSPFASHWGLGCWYLMPYNNISAISWWLVLLVEETGIPGENHRPVASH